VEANTLENSYSVQALAKLCAMHFELEAR